MISSFEAYCLKKPPDFDEIDTQVNGLHLDILSSTSNPDHEGRARRTKIWVIHSPSGDDQLQIMDWFINAQSHAMGCGIRVKDGKGEAFRQALTGRLGLQKPDNESFTDRGQKIATWTKQIDGDWVSIFLSYDDPDHPGVDVSARVFHAGCVPGMKGAVIDRADRTRSGSFGGPAQAVDGQSLDVCGIPVRLYGLTVPGDNAAGDRDATIALREIVGRATISCVEAGIQPAGGALAICLVAGTRDIARTMISTGVARACSGEVLYRAEEQEAKNKHIGIWKDGTLGDAPACRSPK